MPGSRISTEDAKNVEIIHSNAGILGIISPLGHIDFFPNGGSSQVGCSTPASPCSHSRSWEFLAESMNSSDGFYGYKCESQLKTIFKNCKGETARMGGIKDKIEKNGSFYFDTNEKQPYARGLQK